MHLMVELYSVYRAKDNTVFIVSPEKIIVQTKLQEFYLDPIEWDQGYRQDMIAYFIQRGIIDDMASLRRRIKGLFSLQTTYKRHSVLDKV